MMSDDTPTQRFEQPPTGPISGPTGELPEEKKGRGLMIGLIVGGAVLLIAIIVLVVVLATRGGGSPVPTPTPSASRSATPSPTPTPTPTHSATPTPTPTPTTPPSTAPAVTGFTVNTTTVACNASSGVQDPQLAFSWTSTNAAEAYFGVDTNDASIAPYYSNLPPNGDTTSFPDHQSTFGYSCKAGSHKYTITVVGNGDKASKTITVTNTGAH